MVNLKMANLIVILFFISHTHSLSHFDTNKEDFAISKDDKTKDSKKILSRKKRFLIFPTGSSVSIAVCMTVGVYGNPQFSIWSWAVNYGFAYNLPTNSTEFLHPPEDVSTFPFYHFHDDELKKEDPTTTTTTSEPSLTDHIEHSHEDVDSLISNDTVISSRRKFYVYQQPQRFETQPMIHRRYRRDMYRNIEAVIDKMGYNGRDCVLQALCESPMMFEKKKRRTMVQELIKTVFTLPKSKVLPFEHPELLIYDEAYRNGQKDKNCENLYSRCNFSLIKLILGKYSKMPFAGFM